MLVLGLGLHPQSRLYCNISTIILTTFVGFSGGLEDETPYKDNQVYNNVGGKMVTLSHKYTICFINLHNTEATMFEKASISFWSTCLIC